MKRLRTAPSLSIALLLATLAGCSSSDAPLTESEGAATTDSESSASSDTQSEGSSDASAGEAETSSASDSSDDTSDDTETGAGAIEYQGEVWADNWSAMYLGETQIMEDSVPITTERSFNLETFTFEATPPFLLNVVMKDFIENDSGLEYIGEMNQQMGDGGYIAQFKTVSDDSLVAVSNADWRCTTIHEAPLNKDCENSAQPLVDCQSEISDAPEGWMAEDFDDSAWLPATTHSSADVDPKMGYLETTWDPSAEFIWGSDLESHNTILCRVWITQ